MKKINTEFSYDKVKNRGEVKDISKQYLKFFLSLKMTSKAEDLKRVYASNKFISVDYFLNKHNYLHFSIQ